jgi:hypothetical protein
MADKFPLTLPGGQLLPFMSARRRHEIVDTVFEMAGGVERLAHVVNKSDENFFEFAKTLWAKGLPRAVATEHNVSESVEDLLTKLDRAENAKTINANVIDVEPDDAA